MYQPGMAVLRWGKTFPAQAFENHYVLSISKELFNFYYKTMNNNVLPI